VAVYNFSSTGIIGYCPLHVLRGNKIQKKIDELENVEKYPRRCAGDEKLIIDVA